MSSTDPSVDDDELSLVNHSDDEMSIHEELHGADDALQKNEEELARQETAAVFRLRFGVFLVLFLAAIAVSVIVYYITSSAAREESKTQFEGAAEKIIESFLEIVDSKLAAVSSLGVASIAHGVDHIRTWPFVTLSSFQQRSATARSQSDALYVHMNPLVREEDRVAWEVFSQSEDANWM